MRSHRGLEVALLTKRRPPLQPQQVFGCDKDPANPWPLRLHMHGPWMYMNWPHQPVPPPGVDQYRSEWQVHNVVVPYKEYPYHTPRDTHPDDPRVLLPRGTGNCQTYSIVGVELENTSGVLYFQSRMFASPPGSRGAWDFSWSTTIVAPSGSADLLLHIYADAKFGTALRVIDGNLHRLDIATGWIPIAPMPAIPRDTYTRTTEFKCLLAGSWCKVHVNGQTHTIDYQTPFAAFDLVTVELVRTQGDTGGQVAGVSYGRAIQVSDIAIMSAPANKFITYPFE